MDSRKNTGKPVSESLSENQQSPNSGVQNPWPHLRDFFVFVENDKDAGGFLKDSLLSFRCQLCSPRQVVIKAHASSYSNLKSHVKRMHPFKAEAFENQIREGVTSNKKKRQAPCADSGSSSSKQPRQLSITEACSSSTSGRNVRQSVVDDKIVDFFVSNMLPLHVVESASFKELIATLNPSKTSMSRRTLGRRIEALHQTSEASLIKILDPIPIVATTADCWSTHNKSYLGMTVHWIDPKTRTRERAVLSCTRVKGRHSFDVLAENMEATHYKYNLQDKAARTTTDNGSNFVKAFVHFGTDAQQLPNAPQDDENRDDSDPEDDSVEYIAIDETLQEKGTVEHNLPIHMRCAAHTFNLIATADANKALNNALFKSMFRKVQGKAQALWNQQSRSTVSADIIQEELNRRLTVPNATRWNSMYDSMSLLLKLIEENKNSVQRIMIRLKLLTFSDHEIDFLKEYTMVMSIIAKALDKIQGDDQAYLGSLLPTVVATTLRLREVKSKGLQYCECLVDALLEGISKRFNRFLDDRDCQMAAAFHPKFRLFWLEKHDSDLYTRVKSVMQDTLMRALNDNKLTEKCSSEKSDSEDNDDFFGNVTKAKVRKEYSAKLKAETLVNAWLELGSTDDLSDQAFMGEQVIIDLFIKFNTPVPSSAAVERLFSVASDILRAKRACLSDENFERQLFLKGNDHLKQRFNRLV